MTPKDDLTTIAELTKEKTEEGTSEEESSDALPLPDSPEQAELNQASSSDASSLDLPPIGTEDFSTIPEPMEETLPPVGSDTENASLDKENVDFKEEAKTDEIKTEKEPKAPSSNLETVSKDTDTKAEHISDQVLSETSTLPPLPEDTSGSEAVSSEPPPKTGEAVLDQIQKKTPTGISATSEREVLYPFTLTFRGTFTAQEEEKLLEILKEIDLGLSPSEIKTQIQKGKLIFSQISEYLAIWIAQNLKEAQGVWHLKSSAFSKELTQIDEKTTEIFLWDVLKKEAQDISQIPITQALPPDQKNWCTLEEVILTEKIPNFLLEKEKQDSYQQLLENLKQQLQKKAFYLGAEAVFGFQMKLAPLLFSKAYQLTIQGIAMKKEKANASLKSNA